jgi:abequosyltransferase
MTTRMPTLSIAIPSYSRPACLNYLLQTIWSSVKKPDEIVICDDKSPDIQDILKVVERWQSSFAQHGTKFRFIQNETNVGFDRNLKRLIRECGSDYLVFIGNDDAFTSDGISEIYNALLAFPKIKLFSRAFLKFSDTLDSVTGVSRFAQRDRIFERIGTRPRTYLRLSAYFGGLVFCREWALKHESDSFDGSLYYQVYLAGMAFYGEGIGYISTPIVGARTDGTPLFGSAVSEANFHRPGGYSAKARARMWSEVLRIARYIDCRCGVKSESDIHYELASRFSFHVFEAYTSKSLQELIELKRELDGLRLMSHPVPLFLFCYVAIFRRWSSSLFRFARWFYQR